MQRKFPILFWVVLIFVIVVLLLTLYVAFNLSNPAIKF